MKRLAATFEAAFAALVVFAFPIVTLAGNGQWTLAGWNNLGMHCMDSDYSVFSILPPYNTIDAQLMDASGKLVTSGSGITLTYEAIPDPDGSINSTSVGKSSFWDYSPSLFGVMLPADTGLAGTAMPGVANVPQPMTWDGSFNWFGATGIPITPRDDKGRTNSYPMMRITARNAANVVLAHTDIVLPVSDEMDCRACHASNAIRNDARPASGWINDPNPERDYRLNILLRHDDKFLGQSVYQNALAAMSLNAGGLFLSVTQDGKSILCASCHSSEALGTGGYPGTPALTQSMHAMHATVINPTNGLQMDAIANRSACYQCHPGSTTRCLRGAMGSAVAADGSMEMQCQSCHGTMSQVGAASRTGWLDEPNCQSCHTGSATSNNGQIRFTSAFDATGSPRQAINALFATNPNTPAPGKSLYRFSSGHGGLHCSACHGSTHAEFPSSARNDNIQSIQLQGHAGVLIDCIACHASQSNTVTGGPHGMHTVGQTWVNQHNDIVENSGSAQCQACHGANLRGTVLSRSKGDRTLTTKFGTKTFWRGFQVSCYSCHNSPTNEDTATTHVTKVADLPAIITAPNTPVSVALPLKAGWTYRIVSQSVHGTVAFNSATRVATYIPETDYEGLDSFTFAASDGYSDSSNVGVASITVGMVVSAPVVKTGTAGNITAASAQLNGVVNPRGLVTTAQFEFGLTKTYGGTVGVVLSPADGSTPQNVSASLSGLQPGRIYHWRLTATNSQGAGIGKDATFATVGVSGIYYGLLTPNQTSISTAGYLTLSLTSVGSFTGLLKLGTASYSMSGRFDLNGNFGKTIQRKNMPALVLALHLDFISKEIAGSLTDGTDNYSISMGSNPYNAKTHPAPFAGKYTVLIPPPADTSLPRGTGYTTMNVTAAGKVTMAGKIGDGTPFSLGAFVRQDETFVFNMPLYAAAHRGSIYGTVKFQTLPNSDADGTLNWVKPVQTSGSYYPGGFTTSVNLIASRYAAPAKGSQVLHFTNPILGAATLQLSNGDLASTVLDTISVSANNVVLETSGTDKLAMKINTSTGYFGGSFKYPFNAARPLTLKTVTFGGVMFQKQNLGAGVFLGTHTSGSVDVSPQ